MGRILGLVRLKRTPLKRTAMRRRRRSTSYDRRERDMDRMAWCKRQPCALLVLRYALSVAATDPFLER